MNNENLCKTCVGAVDCPDALIGVLKCNDYKSDYFEEESKRYEECGKAVRHEI